MHAIEEICKIVIYSRVGEEGYSLYYHPLLGKPQKKSSFFNGAPIMALPPPPSSLVAQGTLFLVLK